MTKMMRMMQGGFFIIAAFVLAAVPARSCDDISFEHRSSEYYGPGRYLAECPEDGAAIQCHHYHRHWVCENEGVFYWDRNLKSAALAACGCPPAPGTAPASPAVSPPPRPDIFSPGKNDRP
jgi:hypothetical protein